MTFDPSELAYYPEKCGVYLMKNSQGHILYVGKAKSLRARLRQYFVLGQDSRPMVPYLTSQIYTIETIVTFTEKEALLLENTLIKQHKPKYNILLKDDKTHLSLVINNDHPWPRIQLVRTKGPLQTKGEVFGPYTSALAARKTFDIIAKVFPLRQCSDHELSSRKRPCILHSIGRCIAPCVGKCTKKEYDETVQMAIDFLKGKSKELLIKLQQERDAASELLDFERAHTLHQTICQIEETLASSSNVVQFRAKDCDAFSYIKKETFILVVKLSFRKGRLIGSEHFDFTLHLANEEETLTTFLLQHYQKAEKPKEVLLPSPLADASILEELLQLKLHAPRRGEKKALVDLAFENAKTLFEQEQATVDTSAEILLKLQEKLQLTRFPARIECFDTSCSSGKEFVASLVVFLNGKKSPKHYRLYKIRRPDVRDDTAAMHEVLYRRLERGRKEEDLPDLIIVDGGKGQLTQLKSVIKELNIATIDLAALAKEQARHDRGLSKERIFRPHLKEPIEFSRHSSLLFFLQKIRDEAHRRAITFHRKRRAKQSTQSLLDTIPGIGPKKAQLLLKHFGSLKRLSQAPLEEITQLKGISEQDAKNIKEGLNHGFR